MAVANCDTSANINLRSIREVQQSFAESLGYLGSTIWDLLSADQGHILKEKLKEIIKDPQMPKTIDPKKKEEIKKNIEKQCKANSETRDKLFQSLWHQRKYTNRHSLTSIIYVLVATDATEADHQIAPDSKTWSCHPVFRTQRCILNSKNNSTTDCCMIFVDENGRVYQNWTAFVNNNELPAGIMVSPRRGIYNFSGDDVDLETWLTPAASPGKQIINTLDKTTAVGGLAAAAVPICGLLAIPVAAPVMAVAGIVGLTCAGYATIRSGAQLVDRNIHEQSINVTDRTARGHWLGAIAGVVGFGAAGATTAMTAAANAGREVGAVTQLTVNGINITSIMISGTGVANGVFEMIFKYQDGDDISGMDVLQLSASLVIFTHSVYNFKLASRIIEDTSNKRIGDYRNTLSNRQRRMFDKISKETIRTKGVAKGRVDIIRNVNEMPSRQQFNDIYKINKNLNKNGVRMAFASDGAGITLNDQVKTSGAELRASIQHKVGPDVLGQVTNPIPARFEMPNQANAGGPNLTAPLFQSSASQSGNGSANSNFAEGVLLLNSSALLVNGIQILMSKYGKCIFEHIINADTFETVLLSLADNLEYDVIQFILNMLEIFMENAWDELNNTLVFYLSSESVLYQIGVHILDKYRYCSVDELSGHFSEIFVYVKNYFLYKNPVTYNEEKLMKCKECCGFYAICEL